MKRAACCLGLVVLTAVLAGVGVAGREASARGDRHGAAAPSTAALLAALWPARLDDLTGRAAGVASWAEGDRRYVWLRALLATGQAASGPAPVVTPTDAVLRRVLGDPAVPDTGAANEPPCFSATRGGLAWPARGRLAAGFEAGRPSRQGVALATAAGASVRAAAGGRVVFSGRLRGRGRVLIVAHGLHCHTVYACLADVAVAEGATVSRETLLGRAGICPPAGGPGIYFELRFREKALNPAEWFAASE